jgi:hypothetical protein
VPTSSATASVRLANEQRSCVSAHKQRNCVSVTRLRAAQLCQCPQAAQLCQCDSLTSSAAASVPTSSHNCVSVTRLRAAQLRQCPQAAHLCQCDSLTSSATVSAQLAHKQRVQSASLWCSRLAYKLLEVDQMIHSSTSTRVNVGKLWRAVEPRQLPRKVSRSRTELSKAPWPTAAFLVRRGRVFGGAPRRRCKRVSCGRSRCLGLEQLVCLRRRHSLEALYDLATARHSLQPCSQDVCARRGRGGVSTCGSTRVKAASDSN